MAKYADIEEVKAEFRSRYDMQDLYLPVHFFDVMDEVATEDVAPVHHAKWIHPVNSDLKIWVCSNCGGEERNSFKREFGFYCSYCGAKMDLDKNTTKAAETEFIAPGVFAEGEEDNATE